MLRSGGLLDCLVDPHRLALHVRIMTPVHGEVRTVDDVASAFADVVVEAAPSSIALSGGETAKDAYAALATRDLDWSGIDVWFGDERFVPVTDPDSNEGMARAVLLDRVGPGAIHSMASAGDTPDAAAVAYDALLPFGFKCAVSSCMVLIGLSARITIMKACRLISAAVCKSLSTSTGGFLNRCMLAAVDEPACG